MSSVFKRFFKILKKQFLNIFMLNKIRKNTLQFPRKKQNGIIIVNHEGTYGGAPLLGNKMIEFFRCNGIAIDCLFLKNGTLFFDMVKEGSIQLCNSKRQFYHDIKKLIALGYDRIVFNSICSARYIKGLNKLGIKKTITMVHEMPQAIIELGFKKKAKDIVSASDILVFPSNFVKQNFEEKIYKINKRVIIKHQGLYHKYIEDNEKENSKKELCEYFSIDKEKTIILNVASQSYRKGFDIFVNAAEMYKQYNFIWVGDDDNNRYRNEIIKNREITNLILVPYIKNFDHLKKFYMGADCFFLTSREEPFGSVVLESFASGTPVIAFQNCGGYLDVVLHNITGYLFDINELEKLNEGVDYLKNNSANLKINLKKIIEQSSFSEYCYFIYNLITNQD